MHRAKAGESLGEAIRVSLETIVDPCSRAMGAPAGLVSLGLVRNVEIDQEPQSGARVRVTLCLTEPGCLMGAVFQKTVQRQLAELPGVAEVDVRIDHGHVWDPQQLEPTYKARLTQIRARRLDQMRAKRAGSTG
jgi:metal-sulfur cluster biosynthetic enzyme